MDLSPTPSLGLAHFTVLEVPPLELASLAARIGYTAIGLRLHPAFPGSPFYELPAGTAASRHRVLHHRGGLLRPRAYWSARRGKRTGRPTLECLRR